MREIVGAEAPSAAAAEKRQLTVLFADLVGSSRMMETLGAEEYVERLRLYHAACTEAVRQRGGMIAQYQGDGVICYFGYPRAAEDDAERAVAAALDIVAELGRGGGQLRSRIGVATGPVMIRGHADHFGETAVGACLNRAARLEALAAENSVLICATTRKLVGDLFDFAEVRSEALKGFARREAVHQVSRRRRGVASRYEALRGGRALPLVGRAAELERLLARARAARGGRGGTVVVSAEAGMGKSRLIGALRSHPEAAALRVFVLQCSPEHASTPLHPVRDYLEWVAGVAPADGAAARHEKLKRLFSSVWRAGEAQAAWLLDELSPLGSGVAADESLSVPMRRRRAFETLSEMILRSASGREALACIFEDVHWIDPSSAQFVEHLAAKAAGRPLLLVLTTRPEPPFGAGGEGMELVRLDRLDEADSAALARAAAPGGLAPGQFDLVLGKSDGVPLYIEEYAEMLAAAAAEGAAPDADEIPPTIGGLIQGKLDRLDPGARRFSQTASALGRQFDAGEVAAIAGLEPREAARAAAALEAARLARGAGRGDLAEPGRGGAMEFAHALIRDAIHASMSGAQRRALHGRIADHHIAAGAAAMPDGMLADHLARAGRTAEAIERYRAAALQAAGAGAAFEALAHLENGLRAVAALPAGEARDRLEFGFRAIQGPTQMVTRGPGNPAFGATQARAMELMQGHAIGPEMVPVIYNSALHDWARARLAEALATTDLLASVAADIPGDAPRLAAHTMRGLVSWHLGETTAARDSLVATVALYDADRHRDLYAIYLKEFGVFGLFYLGLAETVLGRAAVGARRAQEALALAERVQRPHARGFALLANFMTAWLRGDVEAAERFSAASLAFAEAQGFPEFVAMSRFVQGWAACRRGRLVDGLPLMEAGAAQWDATGFMSWQPLMAAHHARALIAAGELARAEALIDRFEDRVATTGEAQALVPLTLSRAMLLEAEGRRADARPFVLAAAEAAQRRGARAWLVEIEESGLL